MADRFWVGNGGNINDTAHWSLTSGGAGGASVPTATENAKFDANSFTLAGQTVTVNAAFSCLDMDWTGATNNHVLAGSNSVSINGSLTFISSMTVNLSGTISFVATSTGKTVTTAGLPLTCILLFNGVGGGWTLQDNVTTSVNFQLSAGTLNTNGKTVNCLDFSISSSSVRTLTPGSSIFNVSRGFFANTTTNLTITANTATINMSAPVTASTFNGGGLTYNNVNFLTSMYTIAGSSTFTTLTIAVGKTLKLTSGTTQTITNFICNGINGSPSTLQSVTAGSAATIALPSGRYFIRHTSIKDITISGATAVTSIAGTDVSGNTGITFVTKFEIGRIKNDGSFNWYNTSTGTVTKVSG